MDTTFGNDNSAENSIPEPIVEPVEKRPLENTTSTASDSHFDEANVMNLNTPGNKSEIKAEIDKNKKPDPKVLADAFKQSFDNEKDKSKKSQNQYLYYLLIFVIIVVGLLFIRQLSLQRQINELKTNLSVTIVPNQDIGSLTPSVTKNIKTIKPEEFQEISGDVEVNLELESINSIAIKIFDDNGVEVGTLIEDNIELTDSKAVVDKVLDITKSPTVSVGYLIVFPADEDINSPVSKTVSIKFSRNSVVNKINVIGPIRNQLVNSTELDLVGELKGFKDNKIGVRVIDTLGKVLMESQLQALTDNTSQDFVKFDQTVEIGTLSRTTETGNVEFYDISDTNKTPLLSIPIRLR
jgi:hypothetical protein